MDKGEDSKVTSAVVTVFFKFGIIHVHAHVHVYLCVLNSRETLKHLSSVGVGKTNLMIGACALKTYNYVHVML